MREEAATDRERWGSLEWINWQVGFPLGYAGLGGFGKLPEWRCLVGVACPEGPAFPTLPLSLFLQGFFPGVSLGSLEQISRKPQLAPG